MKYTLVIIVFFIINSCCSCGKTKSNYDPNLSRQLSGRVSFLMSKNEADSAYLMKLLIINDSALTLDSNNIIAFDNQIKIFYRTKHFLEAINKLKNEIQKRQ